MSESELLSNYNSENMDDSHKSKKQRELYLDKIFFITALDGYREQIKNAKTSEEKMLLFNKLQKDLEDLEEYKK